jgi:hypothetical protein
MTIKSKFEGTESVVIDWTDLRKKLIDLNFSICINKIY